MVNGMNPAFTSLVVEIPLFTTGFSTIQPRWFSLAASFTACKTSYLHFPARQELASDVFRSKCEVPLLLGSLLTHRIHGTGIFAYIDYKINH